MCRCGSPFEPPQPPPQPGGPPQASMRPAAAAARQDGPPPILALRGGGLGGFCFFLQNCLTETKVAAPDPATRPPVIPTSAGSESCGAGGTFPCWSGGHVQARVSLAVQNQASLRSFVSSLPSLSRACPTRTETCRSGFFAGAAVTLKTSPAWAVVPKRPPEGPIGVGTHFASSVG